MVEEEVLVEIEATNEIILVARPQLPSQQQQTPPQPRRSSRLAGKPPVDFRPFFKYFLEGMMVTLVRRANVPSPGGEDFF